MKVKFIAPANVLSDSRHIHLSPNRLYSVLEAVYYPNNGFTYINLSLFLFLN